MYAHDIIGNLNAGTHVFIDWNIVLDERGGPNHVGNFCGAPIMCDTKADRVVKRLPLDYIGHFSRYIKPGAKRIGSSSYTADLEATAFENPDKSIAAVLLNRTEKELPVTLRLMGETASMVLPENAIATVIVGE